MNVSVFCERGVLLILDGYELNHIHTIVRETKVCTLHHMSCGCFLCFFVVVAVINVFAICVVQMLYDQQRPSFSGLEKWYISD